MKNKVNIPTQLQPDLAKTDNNTIGLNKYNFLKSVPLNALSEMEVMQIKAYEEKHSPSLEQAERKKEYVQSVLSEKEKQSFKTTSLRLWNVFKTFFTNETKKEFEKTEMTIKNIEPLIYYFANDERFFNCENLSKLSVPSFDKGLLIVGTYGNGKTTTMRTFEKIFRNIKGMTFKGFAANDVVGLYEKCNDDISKAEFNKKVNFGIRYFDDVKTERQASNYGKVNLFKDILETRYSNKAKTFISCNYKEGFEGDLEVALEEFGEKYGGRVYDRLFEMFNIIEFKGTSFRK